MKFSVRHDTAYCYDDEVRASIQYLRLTPRESARQHILSWNLELPKPVRAQTDPYGNVLHVLTLDEPHREIVIQASGQVEIDPDCEYERGEGSPLPYLRATRLTQPSDALSDFARQQVGESPDRLAMIALMKVIAGHMTCVPGIARAECVAGEAFANRTGNCQDLVHVFIACARSLGVPARHVSGYLLRTDSAPLSSHAWAEVWFDGNWYTFDVTNGLTRPERHVKLAVGMDYLDSCPVRGIRRGGGYELMHAHLMPEPPLPVSGSTQQQ